MENDFELIVSQEDLQKNRDKALKKNIVIKKLKLKKRVKNIIMVFIIFASALIVFAKLDADLLETKSSECAEQGYGIEVNYTSTGDPYYGCAYGK